MKEGQYWIKQGTRPLLGWSTVLMKHFALKWKKKIWFHFFLNIVNGTIIIKFYLVLNPPIGSRYQLFLVPLSGPARLVKKFCCTPSYYLLLISLNLNVKIFSKTQ